jgi:hypothetical protein
LDLRVPSDFPDPPQGLAQNFALCGSFVFGPQVLVLASPAPPEVRTRRINTLGCGLEDAQRAGVHDALGRADFLNFDAFPGQGAGDEHGPTLVMSQGLASIDQLLRNQFKGHSGLSSKRTHLKSQI